MIRRSLFWSLAISFALTLTTSAWADDSKSPDKEPTPPRPLPADKLVGETEAPKARKAKKAAPKARKAAPKARKAAPKARTKAPESRPVKVAAKPVNKEREQLLQTFRLQMVGGLGLLPRELYLIKMERYLRKNPKDSLLAFYHAYLSLVDGDEAPIKSYCKSKAADQNKFHKFYCNAWKTGVVSTYRSYPPASSTGDLIKELLSDYKAKPTQNLRYDLFMLMGRRSFRAATKTIKETRERLLNDELKQFPNSLTANFLKLAIKMSKSYRDRSKLTFVLPEVQAFAKKYPNFIEAQYLLWRVAKRLVARPLVKVAIKRLYKFGEGKSYTNKNILFMVHYRTKKYGKALKVVSEMVKLKPSAEEEYHFVNLVSSMVSRVSWKKRKQADALYDQLLKKYPKHARVYIEAGYNKYQLKKKEEAIKLYETAIPMIDNLRLLRSLYWKLSYRNRPLALKLMSHQLKRNPNNAWCLGKRAYIYKRMGKHDKAQKDYDTLLSGKFPISASIYSSIASHYQYQSNYPKALKILTRGLKAHPNAKSLYSSRAYIYNRMNKPKLAAADYLKAYKAGSGNYWTAQSYVRQLQKMNQHDKAIAFIKVEMKKASSYYKKRFVSLYTKALFKAGKTKEAQEYVLKSGDARALLNAAQTQRRRRKYKIALSYCRAALLKPARKYTKRSIYQEMATIYKKMLKNDKAAEVYQKIISLDPDRYYSYYSLANFYRYTLKKPKKAVKVWDSYIARKPKKANGYFYRAEAYKAAKDNTAALLDYMRGLNHSKKKRYDYSRIVSFLRYSMKRYDLAAGIWSDYILQNPKDAYAYRSRAGVYAKLKRYDDAKRDYHKAIALKPNELYNYSTLADLYQYNLKKPAQALDVWSKLIAKQPKNPKAYRKRAYLFRRLKQYGKATADYETAIKLKPNDRYSYRPLASMYSYYLKDKSKAISVWSRYIKIRSFDAYGYIERAQLYEKVKDWKKALGDWKVAKKKVTSSWRRNTVNKGLGRCYNELGMYQKAVNLLKPLLAKTTSSYRRKAIAKELIRSLEKLGNYKEAIKLNKPFLKNRYDRKPKFTYVRLLAGSGQFDKALAQALSYCSGAEKMRYSYYRRRACKQHKWLAYGLQLMNNPFNVQSYTKALESPNQKKTRSNTNFKNILKLLLRRGKKKAPIRPVPVRPRK